MNVDNLYAEIGQNIRTARTLRGISQEELAEKLNIKRTSVSNIENGKQRLPLHLIYQVCNLLKLDIHKVIPANIHNMNGSALTIDGVSVSQHTQDVIKKYTSNINSIMN